MFKLTEVYNTLLPMVQRLLVNLWLKSEFNLRLVQLVIELIMMWIMKFVL